MISTEYDGETVAKFRVFGERVVTARKNHVCELGGEVIVPGERYVRVTGVCGGELVGQAECLRFDCRGRVG